MVMSASRRPQPGQIDSVSPRRDYPDVGKSLRQLGIVLLAAMVTLAAAIILRPAKVPRERKDALPIKKWPSEADLAPYFGPTSMPALVTGETYTVTGYALPTQTDYRKPPTPRDSNTRP